jgi:SAM-dependent methyltransferase
VGERTVNGRRLVHRVEDGMDRQGVYATTYQMRNFYRQLGDGFFTVLDTMNYIQHHQIAKWCKPGNHILDVCVGRGLMLPLLRYHRKTIGSYTGVDIDPSNATYRAKRVTDGTRLKQPADEYYPFPVRFVEADVAAMSGPLADLAPFDVLIYTSAIEHMHHDAGLASLHECRKVAKPGAVMILTTPNTPEGKDGYDTQYRAHVYEWTRSELLEGLAAAGWEVVTEFGLLIGKTELKAQAERLGLLPVIERLERFVPSEWLLPVFAPMFPTVAKEIAFVAKAA